MTPGSRSWEAQKKRFLKACQEKDDVKYGPNRTQNLSLIHIYPLRKKSRSWTPCSPTVSYTHLDVYKRQFKNRVFGASQLREPGVMPKRSCRKFSSLVFSSSRRTR